MPPFSGASATANPPSNPDPNVVSINVGGQIFQTTRQTLTAAGPNSILNSISDPPSSSSSSSSSYEQSDVPFIDRDPELFSIILSLLRSGNFPSSMAKSFDLHDIISEAQFFGVESLLIESLSSPSLFNPFDLHKSAALQLNGRDSPSAIATTPFGHLHVAHGSKLTSFDWSLRRKSTVLTQFAGIDSLIALSPSLAAAGATDFSGLQIIDVKEGVVKEHLNWENSTRSSSTVQAIGSSPEFLFTSFESGRRNSNVIVAYDLADGLRPAVEIARNEIYGAEIDSAVPATKLLWLSSRNLLMASGSHSGPTRVSGNVKLWDVRTGKVAWEVEEKEDCFADVTMSDSLSAMFKVGVSSGEVYFLDLRSLGAVNRWVCLEEGRKVSNGKKEGLGCKIESHGSQVFRSKGGELEVWCEVLVGSSRVSQDQLKESVYRRNTMGRAKDQGGGKITNLAFGGNKMFVSRKDEQSVEVWQSSARRC